MIKTHVLREGWTDVEHYWIRNGDCEADKEHKLDGIPHCILVDTFGAIVFHGHPKERNFEEDISKLLKGEKISGSGTSRTSIENDNTAPADGKNEATCNESLNLDDAEA